MNCKYIFLGCSEFFNSQNSLPSIDGSFQCPFNDQSICNKLSSECENYYWAIDNVFRYNHWECYDDHCFYDEVKQFCDPSRSLSELLSKNKVNNDTSSSSQASDVCNSSLEGCSSGCCDIANWIEGLVENNVVDFDWIDAPWVNGTDVFTCIGNDGHEIENCLMNRCAKW